ncbi:MAG: type II secretion system protein GspL [Microcoleus sp.]
MGYNKLFYRDKPIIGLDISQTGLKAMSVDPKGWTVRAYGNCNLDPAKLNDSIEQGTEFLAQGITELLEKHMVGPVHTTRVVLSVPTARTFNRSLTLPLEAEKNLLEAVQLEAEQYIPIPVSQLYLDFNIINRTKKTIEINLCAVPKLIVNNCISACEAAGLEVVMIEPGVNAVARLLTHTEEGSLPTVIVDIGAASTDIAILNKNIRVTGDVAVGGNSFTLDIANKLKVTLENAHQLKVLNGLAAGPKQAKVTDALEPSLKRIVTEVKKIIRYYTERIGATEKLEQIIIVGGGSNVPGIGEYFTK